MSDEANIRTASIKATLDAMPGLTFGDVVDYFHAKPGNDTWYIAEAQRTSQQGGVLEINDNAIVSDSDDGAYVMAWVWVDDTREKEE